TDVTGRLIGRDAFVALGAMFAATTRVRGTVGVAAMPMHHPVVLASVASTLHEMSDGRFGLGLGVSHPEQTARFGLPFPDRPVEAMRGWLRELRTFSADGVAHGAGWPVLVAALGPRMVELGATEAD